VKYVYPAVFVPENKGGFSVHFPDIPMGATQGESIIECMDAAEMFLGDALCFIEDEKREIPKITAMADVIASDKDIVTLISVDTMEYRRKYESKAVKKTLTIPAWLNRQAEKENAPFSQILQQGLKDYLQIAN